MANWAGQFADIGRSFRVAVPSIVALNGARADIDDATPELSGKRLITTG
jgi:hypothetical protein